MRRPRADSMDSLSTSPPHLTSKVEVVYLQNAERRQEEPTSGL
jgi:hypothetical protein